MAKKRLTSLSDLAGIGPGGSGGNKKKKKKKSDPVARVMERLKTEKPQEPEQEPGERRERQENELFMSAMQGVERMEPTGKGREIVPDKPEPETPPLADPEAEAKKRLRQFMAGEIEFDLEYSEEYMRGAVKGLDSKIMNKLKAGAYSVEAHVDLHGLNALQAYDTLIFFLRESYLQGRRCVLVVSGRGKGSPGGMSVLKRELQTWLTREPLRRVVLAFATSLPKHGGAGALYVLLRKKKKTTGKVAWNRTEPPE